MKVRRRGSKLERWEVALIKAMSVSAQMCSALAFDILRYVRIESGRRWGRFPRGATAT